MPTSEALSSPSFPSINPAAARTQGQAPRNLWESVNTAAQGVWTRVRGVSRQIPHRASPSLPPGPRPVPRFAAEYFRKLESAWTSHEWENVEILFSALQRCWRENSQVFLCGNGGSAANAIHLANDLLYGVDKKSGRGLRVVALPANAAVVTCLANDLAYSEVFSQQLSVLGGPRDILIAFSGSGNSPNIIKALERAREIGMETFAILGYAGGQALALADHPIHFAVSDMQVSEDLQMMVGHMAMQALARAGRESI